MKKKYMSDVMFNELMDSMDQAIKITKGEMKPARVFVYSAENVKEIRENTKTYLQKDQTIV